MLIKQTTDHTCAQAALISITNFLGFSHTWEELLLAKVMGCSEEGGTTLFEMGSFSVKNLNAKSFGENSWDGKSPMVAVITEHRLQEGKKTHAVVVLSVVNEMIISYCPFFGVISVQSVVEFNTFFHSEDEKYKRWTINF